MPKAVKGVLVECDPSIKAIILKIDQERHDYIVEDLDDQTLVIKESQLPGLKERLDKVCTQIEVGRPQPFNRITQILVDTQQMPDESGSD
ncbi:MAG: hypothetical protein LQ341_001875 [Variospora aurantia]|nr:MAG: hypothetical protein LQ341_001875 [Variospora aurantia]